MEVIMEQTLEQENVTTQQLEDTAPTTQKSDSTVETSKSELKYSDADVNKLINQKFEKWQKKQEETVNEATRLAQMNESQKAQYELEKLQKENVALKKTQTLGEMSQIARSMLSENNLNISDNLLKTLVSIDAGETKKNVEGFKALLETEVEKVVRERLKGTTPSKGVGKVTVTKEEIMQVKDAVERQQLIAENMDLFQ